MANAIAACPLRSHLDPRLVRFSAGATAGVLALVLALAGVVRPVALFLLATQVSVFAFTAFVSFQWSVWARLFARFVWPRLAPPAGLEDAKPHRFAQLVGLVLTAVALVGFVAGVDVVGYAGTALACAVTALNAATGVCLGCRLHALVRPRPPSA